ncbi:MAG: GIY-YIG nuclease family protein [Bacteroidota bacterium]
MKVKTPKQPRPHNYKKEKYFDTASLITYLDEVCATLITNFLTPGRNHLVKDLMNVKDRDFNALWHAAHNNEENKHSKNEFKGIYAFATVDRNDVDFHYIGISQTIRRRFGKHTLKKRKNEASWAYLMAKHHHPDLSNEDRQLKIPEYQQKYIHPVRFTFCQVDDHMLMHIAEVYCANKLRAEWNTFETH